MTTTPAILRNSIVGQLNSTDNKALLWSILAEENIFAGLSENSLQPMITLFETAIHTTMNSYAQDPTSIRGESNDTVLSEMNKYVIKRIIHDVAVYKSQSSLQPVHSAPVTTSNTSTPLYKSADIQEARIKDITSKVKVLENDMNSFLVLKKPPEIDFSDKNVKDDLPIGDNMDQLIKDALAARERELEVIQFDIPPTPPQQQHQQQSRIQTTDTNISITTKKTVSFEEPNDAELEIGNIFSKLKKPALAKPPENVELDTITNVSKVSKSYEQGQFTDINNKLETIMNTIRELQISVSSVALEVQFIKTNMFNYDETTDSNLPE